MNGASASRARRRAISVLPTPVGPIIRMFFGVISWRSGSATCWRRQRLRSAMATARFALPCPTMYLSSSWTISCGVIPLMRRFTPVLRWFFADWCRCRCRRRSRAPCRRSPCGARSVFSSSARAAACAYGPPEPMARMPCSGSSTSPMPVMISECSLSATASIASRRRRMRSVRQSLASSTAERIRLPWCLSSLASKRSNSVNASAVPPAKPARMRSWYRRRTLRAPPLRTTLPERDLAVAAERDARAAADRKDGGAVQLFHGSCLRGDARRKRQVRAEMRAQTG